MTDSSSAPVTEPFSPSEDNWTLVEGEATTEMTDTAPETQETKQETKKEPQIDDDDKCPGALGGQHTFQNNTCTLCGAILRDQDKEQCPAEMGGSHNFEDNKCTLCGLIQPGTQDEARCPAEMGGSHNFEDNKCTLCGFVQPETQNESGKEQSEDYKTTSSPSPDEEKKDEKKKEEKKKAQEKFEAEKEKKLREEKEKLEDEKRLKVSLEKEIKGSKTSDPQIELKFIIIGDTGVGKTNLLSRFIGDVYNMNSISTISVEAARKALVMEDGQKIRVSVWDTAGQERYRAVARSFYKGLNAVFLVYDSADPHSLTSISDWYDEVRQNCDTEPEMILVGNKADLAVECSTFVSADDARPVADKHKMLLFQVSAKTGDNCQKVVNKTIELCYDKILKGSMTKVVAPPLPLGGKQKKGGCC